MRKKILTVILAVTVLLSACIMSACSAWDKDVKVVLNNMGNIENTYTVSIFKNVVLADIKTEKVIGTTPMIGEDGKPVIKDGKPVQQNVEFLGWHPDPGADNGLYKANGLLRLAEVQNYVHDGVLVLYAIYGVRVIEKHDLIIAWYGQAVAGLTDQIMENYSTALINWLEDDLKLLGVDVVIRKYTGDVATSCAEVVYDGGADIMLGWGKNLTSTGGIEVKDENRKDGIAMGIKVGRYVDLIRETEKMVDAETSLSRKVWQWSIDHAELFL